MTSTMGGRWIQLPSGRRDWVPDDQPPSPDGGPGAWHIVGASGELGEWEWHPAPPPVMTRPPSPVVARDPAVRMPTGPTHAAMGADAPVLPPEPRTPSAGIPAPSPAQQSAAGPPATADAPKEGPPRRRRVALVPPDLSELGRKLAWMADHEPDTPGARNPRWNSWRRVGRIFAWWLLFTTIYGVLIGIAGVLWSFDRNATDHLATGFARAAMVAAVPSAIAFLWGMVKLIPQLFHVTSELR